MPKFHVACSTTIESPLDHVKTSLCDYRQWPTWSPWLISEPDATLEYSGNQGEVGCGYTWAGEMVGAGGMELKSITDNQLLMQLDFIKPFKSQAEVIFDLKAIGDSTEVTWNMHGSMPFFLFFMIKHMKVWIGMDYERGLKMLKDYLETGTVASSVSIDGVEKAESVAFVGISNSCSFDDIGKTMSADFDRLHRYTQENELALSSPPFTLYNTFDPAKRQTNYVAAIPVDSPVSEAPEGMITGELSAGKVLKVTHTGKYYHLGNAWATGMTYARYKKIKTKKSPVGVEFYVSDPRETAEDELVTQVFLPIR